MDVGNTLERIPRQYLGLIVMAHYMTLLMAERLQMGGGQNPVRVMIVN
jgi:hypothetical protein